MSHEDHIETKDSEEKTIKAAGQIVKYSREIYHLESVEEVAMLTLEATPHFIEGYPSPAVVEIRDDGLRVLESMLQGLERGEVPRGLTKAAYERGNVLICPGDDVEVNYTTEDVEVVSPAAYDTFESGVTVAAPTVYSDGVGDSGAILIVHWDSLSRVEKHHVRPVDFLGEHVATAIVNIRSRERLERARNVLARQKEMLEVYDSLLRHDLGNDLQVISGFSDAMLTVIDVSEEPEQTLEYAEKIFRTANSAADLIDTVGETVKTVQKEGHAEAHPLRPTLVGVVDAVETKFDTLTVEFTPSEFEYEVYTGDLIDSVFTNILSNAAVHNDRPVTVRLYTEEPTPEHVVVGIADNGSGIPENVRDVIFEMGKKGRDSDGTGLGLGLARTLLESYGGSIEVGESEWGGAEFRITLVRA